ncbi:MAG TPA: PEP-CTERM sorting domain-containing protein [Falsiroseomonas sp.]|jgi:hypothetical protein|nr:PEP-CTERM sorting domain-containing protein [Falsiroseomonas sp.]
MKFGWIGACGLAFIVAAAPLRHGEAALVTCAPVTLGAVEGATACGYDTAFFNDSEAVVNRSATGEAGYFGHSDWDMVGRVENGGKSDAFDFAAYQLGGADMFMLVFKSGSKKQSPSLIAYLVDVLAGDWQTPFTNVPFPNHPVAGRDVSHISYYVRTAGLPEPSPLPDLAATPTAGVDIPAPAALALFGLGLAGLAVVRRARAP